MPKVEYEGQIYIIDTPEQADFAARYLSQFPLLGIDTETRPCYKKGESHKVGLLQIATEDRCYLFRTYKFGLTASLISLLENPNIAKIGVSLKDDFLMLMKWTQFKPKNIIELQTFVREIGITDMSLQKIYANLFGAKISKSQRMSNWEADELTVSQQHYAAIDAWACIKIYQKVKELKDTGNFELIVVPEPVAEPVPVASSSTESKEQSTNI